jgi:hypothetical protein
MLAMLSVTAITSMISPPFLPELPGISPIKNYHIYAMLLIRTLHDFVA